MLTDPEIDAVIISTPDHWHSQPAMEAALAGKDIYLQKPTSLTIEEGRQLSDIVHRQGVILQLGTQQRSSPQFRIAAELVRNGRIGRLHTVKVGLPGDPSGPEAEEMPVPDARCQPRRSCAGCLFLPCAHALSGLQASRHHA